MKTSLSFVVGLSAVSLIVGAAQAQNQAPPVAEQPAAEPAASLPQPPADAPLISYSASNTKVMTAMSPGKAAFAVLGAAAMIEEGKKIIAENGIVDPSSSIAHDVAAELARSKGARVAGAPLALERKGLMVPKPEVLAAASVGSAYVVDVDSGWTLLYFPTDWAHYKVMFISNMRVVDLATKKVVAKHVCNWATDKAGEPKYTRDELLTDQAKGLKGAIVRGAEACTAEFKGKLGGGASATTTAAAP